MSDVSVYSRVETCVWDWSPQSGSTVSHSGLKHCPVPAATLLWAADNIIEIRLITQSIFLLSLWGFIRPWTFPFPEEYRQTRYISNTRPFQKTFLVSSSVKKHKISGDICPLWENPCYFSHLWCSRCNFSLITACASLTLCLLSLSMHRFVLLPRRWPIRRFGFLRACTSPGACTSGDGICFVITFDLWFYFCETLVNFVQLLLWGRISFSRFFLLFSFSFC